ncbi:hypothetical protein BDZ85DRAFT_226628 [Elsinoe ampelina]|uniref:Zn(2)-C6 fungal-type domain-containing protein n=1 Tax=Elsinoe ampelina TaxID=302913 RepID=A0A6A6FYV1_9PEZI|nr:hypothetical protein BDZ85DRAFT_226628 [Elsinoe ampelina]
MPRKPHKKSRFGCANCKKRHQKCDESRPTCVNCRTAGTECSYLLPSSISRRSGSAVAQNSRDSSENNTPTSQTTSPAVASGSVAFPDRTASITDLNLAHMELFYRFLQNPELSFGLGLEHPEEGLRLLIKNAFKSRYLMSLILAVTSIRQAIDEPHRHVDLYQQSMELLDSGLRELYKETETITECNIAPIFMASSITGIYMLCDTFIIKHDEPPAIFLDRIINTIKVTRGARAVMDNGAWMLLANSEIRPMLGFDLQEPMKIDEGEEHENFSKLFDLIKLSALPEDERAACDAAVQQLLRSFGSKSNVPHLRRASRFLRGRAWPVTTSPLYVDMLNRRVPEALVILANWSVLLHQISDVWQLGEASSLLMSAVGPALGHEWNSWLEWPREFISRPRMNSAATTPA